MILPGPLKDGVQKIETGLYTYRGLYLRFNRMEGLGTKWTSHYYKCDGVLMNAWRSDSLRGLIRGMDVLFDDLAAECNVAGFEREY